MAKVQAEEENTMNDKTRVLVCAGCGEQIGRPHKPHCSVGGS